MKIIQLSASNFARLSAVEIRPDGAVVAVRGKNGNGKTSVLKAIWTAFVGRAAAPPRAIRDGTEEARLRVDVGDGVSGHADLIIERTIRRDKHGGEAWDLKVTQGHGARVTRKPQELIDAALDALAFDPLAFARAKPPEQLAQLKALIPGVNFDKLARERQTLFDERTQANRDAKAAHARANGIELPPGPEPAAVDTAGLLAELERANRHNADRARATFRHVERLHKRDQLRADAEQMLREAEQLDEVLSIVTIPEAIDTAAITAQINAAQRTESVRRAFEHRRTHEQESEQAGAIASELTAAIDALDVQVREAVASAQLPAGLSMTADGVLLNGLPFEQASDAEKIIASAQVRMALSPELRVMLIDRAESLDASSMQALARLAEDRDYQIWAAIVDEGDGAPGFYIEDGRVARKEAAE